MGEIQQVRASKPLMDLLIIDDTLFVGRHPACAALARSDCITRFNRGPSASPPAPISIGVTLLRGAQAKRFRRWLVAAGTQ